jgi:3-carboxy-cis,cis-muconate cycloisomerase
LAATRSEVERVQIGGAAGDRGALGDAAPIVARTVADRLGLREPGHSWHSTREGIAAQSAAMAAISGTLGKMGQDICLMAQQGVDEVALVSGGGGSSAMPHKQNPVLAELLVTLARFNATQVSAMHHAMIHEQERSGAAWGLEWMVLPQMAVATARGLSAALELTADIARLGPLD